MYRKPAIHGYRGTRTGKTTIVEVNAGNISEYGFFCVRDRKHPGYQKKRDWLEKRFKDGLRTKLLFPTGEKKAAGFIEYLPGQYAWRPVEADGYLVIHCIFIEKRKFKGHGYGSMLVQECINDARKHSMNGVAVVTSEGTWMASPELFLKNGFELVDEAPPHFKLMAKRLKKASPPRFRRGLNKRLEEYKGLNLLYTHQCPFSARFLNDIEQFAENQGVKLKSIDLRTAREAQDAPCAYGTFTLVYNGKVLAEHPISRTRFRNIVKKELKLI